MKLSDNGIAVLWYGKLSTPFWGDYYVVPSSKFRRRECSLFIHPSFMEKICSEFTIIDHQIKNFKDPIKKIGHSMQSKIVIKKKKYLEIDNFYTTTIYEKGAEIIRMLSKIVKEENFYQIELRIFQ
mgnify:CR=1 FL=1